MVASIRKRPSPSTSSWMSRLLSTSSVSAASTSKLGFWILDFGTSDPASSSNPKSKIPDGGGGGERTAAGKDGKAAEERLGRRAEQVIAPGDGVAQGLLAHRQV